jgi:hypothetical protein
MHPAFTQEMARQHREELLRRAAIERAALHLIEQENSKGFRRVFAFLEPLHDMSTILSRRPVIIQRRKYSDVDFDEIKHELQVTFAAMRKMGSECDDHFIDVFMRKLRRELPSAGELLLVKIPTPGQRLLLVVVMAGILASLLGMMIGISQGILLGISLLCFVIVAVGIVLKSI